MVRTEFTDRIQRERVRVRARGKVRDSVGVVASISRSKSQTSRHAVLLPQTQEGYI